MKRLSILAILPLAAAANALVCLDDFSDGDYSVTIQSGQDLALTAGTSPVGGDRLTNAIVEANPNTQDLTLAVGSGFTVTSSGAGLDGLIELGYGYSSVTPITLDPMNLDLSGETAFRMTYNFNDLAHSLRINLRTGAGAFEAHSIVVAGGIVSPTEVEINFSEWTTIDFSDVDHIVVQFDTPANGDFAVSKFEAVPEPATMVALGIGAAALIRRRRK